MGSCLPRYERDLFVYLCVSLRWDSKVGKLKSSNVKLLLQLKATRSPRFSGGRTRKASLRHAARDLHVNAIDLLHSLTRHQMAHTVFHTILQIEAHILLPHPLPSVARSYKECQGRQKRSFWVNFLSSCWVCYPFASLYLRNPDISHAYHSEPDEQVRPFSH